LSVTKILFPFLSEHILSWKDLRLLAKMLIAHLGDAVPMRITIETSIHPTEDPDRVAAAILNIFPDASPKDSAADDWLVYEAADPAMLAEKMANQRIRDTARAILVRSLRAGKIFFRLSKQAALAGRVNFTDAGSALGDLAVTVETEYPEAAIGILTGGRR
jgi:predicted RNA binding protein with dsRBD fold (UPF0201 family)